MRRFLLATAAVLAAVVVFLLITLPPRPVMAVGTVDPDLRARTIAGAYHVHTTRSDGAEDPISIARAASKAGLRFVIFTDHGDGTRTPDAPVYRDGVLCLDAAEISTAGGHYVALDMPASPYPLGGEPSAVVEDVSRLGGFGVAAHPDSPKPELAWTDWTVPFDGIEWLSADTEWRNESRARLARVLFDYFVRPAGSLASTLDRPAAALARWDAAASRRPVVALGALDAHGGVRRRVEGGSRMTVAGVPSYDASFRSFAVRVIPDLPLTGRADIDSRLVLGAIRLGRVFTAIDAVAGPAYLDFHAGTARVDYVNMGGASRDNTAILSVAAPVPEGGRIVLLRNGAEVAREQGSQLRARASGPGAYRVEVQAPRAPGAPTVPWILSNPIYVNLPSPPAALVPDGAPVINLRDCTWHVEKDPGSQATLAPSLGAARLSYQLRGGGAASQFVALACDLPATTTAFGFVDFHVRSRSPARVSVQLRFGSDGDQRWIKSVYADSNARNVHVNLDDLVPADRGFSRRPDTARATTLLFVIDLTNAAPGSAGEFTVGVPLPRRPEPVG